MTITRKRFVWLFGWGTKCAGFAQPTWACQNVIDSDQRLFYSSWGALNSYTSNFSKGITERGYRIWGLGKQSGAAEASLQPQIGRLLPRYIIPDAQKRTVQRFPYFTLQCARDVFAGLSDYKQQHNAYGRGRSGESAGVSSIAKQLHLKSSEREPSMGWEEI